MTAEEKKAAAAAKKEEKLRAETLSKLTELGIEHDPSLSTEELVALLPEEPKKAKEEPVLLATKGKFSLFQVGKGFEIKDSLDRLISKPEDSEKAYKLLSDLSR